ncbi:MAG: S41 family peptidase [Phycisphaeraceae bacterium]|nr:S41 family peptidase [Phycisphaeraceae bacterium]
MMRSRVLSVAAGMAVAAAGLLAGTTMPAMAQSVSADSSRIETVGDLSQRAWADARTNRATDLLALSGELRGQELPAELGSLRDAFASLEVNIAKREATRAEKIAEAERKLAEKLDAEDATALSDAIRFAVELFMLTPQDHRAGLLAQPRITDLVERATAAARAAERNGEWFVANELFWRLNVLLEEQGTFKNDVRRLGQRLSMIRLYAPERFWELRNDERLKDGKTPLPPFNALGEDYRSKLEGVKLLMVAQAIVSASRSQIDRVPMRDALISGLDAVRVMITTDDLHRAFPTLADDEGRARVLAFIDERTRELESPVTLVSNNTLISTIEDTLSISDATLKLPAAAVLHEFGNGAMQRYDEFSAIIWPDELARFNRMTQGNFRGVGIQIQYDDDSQMIKVVTPIEGTPAQRAGIRQGDRITRIDGKSAVGITVNQAVDLITGPADSRVTLTMERPTGETDDAGKEIVKEIDFPLVRAVIPLATVKGWRRSGPREDQWDWFIDPAAGIGYVRLLQFTDDTTKDLHSAIDQMRRQGLRGLILDLRFNPGGLLTEAVSVANTFIREGTIVSTQGTTPGEVKRAVPSGNRLRGVPLVVLINEGSASASEIVSGAIRHYADKGDIDAVVVGQRTFGKGSVQNVFELSAVAKMKLTTQYYKMPDGRIIHRRGGDSVWGVDPHLAVDMLPEQSAEALRLRQDADVLPIDEKGNIVATAKPAADPRKLIDDGIDLQLQHALLLLQTKAAAGAHEQVRLTKNN